MSSSFGEIIPIESRRRPQVAPAPQPAAPPEAPGARRRRRWESLGGAVGVVAIMLAVGGGGILCERRVQAGVAELPAARRAAVVARVRAELAETCGEPEAATGPLHDRCVDSARFVLLFPECDAACARGARALLPRARR